MSAIGFALRGHASYWSGRSRRARLTAGAGFTLVVGGSAWLYARRSERWDTDQLFETYRRGEHELMKRLKIRRLSTRQGARPVDRKRIRRLYEFQVKHLRTGPFELYDELVGPVR
jgi:hypothetical protein